MAFVNEWVSQEDIKKYDLPSFWMKFHWWTPVTYTWTVDRQRNVFLLKVGSGREDTSNHIDFVLCWDGEITRIGLIKHEASQSPNEMATRWELIGFDFPNVSAHSRDEIVDMLKDALRAYKRSGIVWPVENHTSIFDF